MIRIQDELTRLTKDYNDELTALVDILSTDWKNLPKGTAVVATDHLKYVIEPFRQECMYHYAGHTSDSFQVFSGQRSEFTAGGRTTNLTYCRVIK